MEESTKMAGFLVLAHGVVSDFRRIVLAENKKILPAYFAYNHHHGLYNTAGSTSAFDVMPNSLQRLPVGGRLSAVTLKVL